MIFSDKTKQIAINLYVILISLLFLIQICYILHIIDIKARHSKGHNPYLNASKTMFSSLRRHTGEAKQKC